MNKPFVPINFEQKLYDYLPGVINLAELDPDEKLKDTSVFTFDKDKDGCLNQEEFSELKKAFDTDSDNVISEKEIKDYCKKNNISKNLREDVKFFLSSMFEKFINKKEEKVVSYEKNDSNETSASFYKFEVFGGTKSADLKKINYDNGLVKYQTKKDKTYSHKAFYNENEDKFIGKNNNQTIEISGVKSYLDKGENPKLIITNLDGTKKEIVIHISALTNFDFKDSTNSKEDNLMYTMTQLMDNIQSLESVVIEDLLRNVSVIKLDYLGGSTMGQADCGYDKQNIEVYKEVLTLDVYRGFDSEVLSHEVAHTVDMCPENFSKTFLTKDSAYSKELNGFIKYIKSNYKNFSNAYCLKNPQELYAEYYCFKNTGTTPRADSSKLFSLLEKENGSEWVKIKNILDNVKKESFEKYNMYEQADVIAKNDMQNFDSKEDAISEEDFNKKFEDKSSFIKFLRFNEYANSNTVNEIVCRYPKLKRLYDKNTRDSKSVNNLEIVRLFRNHPDVKPLLLSFWKSSDNI